MWTDLELVSSGSCTDTPIYRGGGKGNREGGGEGKEEGEEEGR